MGKATFAAIGTRYSIRTAPIGVVIMTTIFRLLVIGILLLCWTPHAASAQNDANSSAPNSARDENAPNDRNTASSGQADWAIAELIRIQDRMRQIDEQLSRISVGMAAAARIEQASRSIVELKSSPLLACGAPQDARLPFNASLRRTLETLGSVSRQLPTFYPWEESDPAALEAMCGPQLRAALEEIEAGITRMSNDLGGSADSRDALNRELGELRSRKQAIVTQMADNVASARVAKTMPYILVIIFSLGVLMMLGARLFSPTIQSELICSGQLVQFVTILILFGALLALGLADKLQEQTLAALLGGLAGYVLSQGIGQKERQSTLQTLRTMANTTERIGSTRRETSDGDSRVETTRTTGGTQQNENSQRSQDVGQARDLAQADNSVPLEDSRNVQGSATDQAGHDTPR